MDQLLHCKRCKMVKTADAFYASNHTICKTCVCKAVRTNRESNAEYYQAYERGRAARPDRVAARSVYIKTDAGCASHNRSTRKYSVANAMRRAAQVALGNAVRDGRVIPWPACAMPECGVRPEAHHVDYGQPLQIVWLCPAHHKQAHAMARFQFKEAA